MPRPRRVSSYEHPMVPTVNCNSVARRNTLHASGMYEDIGEFTESYGEYVLPMKWSQAPLTVASDIFSHSSVANPCSAG